MTIEAMRQELLRRYSGSRNWCEKVKTMPDSQVYAVYIRIGKEKVHA
jgi:hypothetical protein